MRKDAALVMKWAKLSDVPMLPVHDSFVVRRQDAAACEVHMKQTYHAYMGINPEVRVSQAPRY